MANEWDDDVILCTPNDVLHKVFSISGIVNIDYHDANGQGFDSNAEDSIIVKKIDYVKGYTKRLLLRDAKPLIDRSLPAYGYSGYYGYLTSCGTSLETFCDYIQNYAILKEFAICKVIAELYLFGDTVISVGLDNETRSRMRGIWEAKALEEWELAFPLLWFDLDSDGLRSYAESLTTGTAGPYTFSRV